MRPQRFRTRITELLGIRHPIVAGGLMWLADANYVGAVVNAGGMGFITARSFPDPEKFADELRRAREITRGHAFGVNLQLSTHGAGNDLVEELLRVALAEGVRHFETSGLPPFRLVRHIREVAPESVVIHKVASVRHAVSAANKLAVDAVSVVGAECGGHPGLDLVGTMVQAPLATRRIELPILIGGGIGTGAQLAACLTMGAAGVVIGTRFLVSDELWSHPAVKQRVVDSSESDTALVLASMRNTYRCIANQTAASVAELEASGVDDFEQYRGHLRGSLQKEAYEVGDPERGILSMGQACVFADRVEPVETIIDRIIDEAVEAVTVVGSLQVAPDAGVPAA